MSTQAKLWTGVAIGFLLMALAWTALFLAASKADVKTIPLAPPPPAQSSYYEHPSHPAASHLVNGSTAQCSYYEQLWLCARCGEVRSATAQCSYYEHCGWEGVA